MNLSFDALREANLSRRRELREAGHKWGAKRTPSEWLEALVGEVGEYANFAKKYRRGDIDRDRFLAEAAKELADAQAYLDLLAESLGIDLGRATAAKFDEVSARVGSSVRLDRDPHEWRTGFPPSTGWWNASRVLDGDCWRWFDAAGQEWGAGAYGGMNAGEAAQRAREAVVADGILWRWYWPENARVPPSGRPA